jgi:hypothetical protein
MLSGGAHGIVSAPRRLSSEMRMVCAVNVRNNSGVGSEATALHTSSLTVRPSEKN